LEVHALCKPNTSHLEALSAVL